MTLPRARFCLSRPCEKLGGKYELRSVAYSVPAAVFASTRVRMNSLRVPRLGKSYEAATIDEEVTASVVKIVGHRPTSEQLEVVKAFLSGRDVFVSLPTGSGKSVCFACLPQLFNRLRFLKERAKQHPSIVVVVSPLVSLMLNQVTKLTAKGVSAAYIGGAQHDPSVWSSVENGDCQVVYTSPETLLSQREIFHSQVYQNNLVCLAVDEAHLVEKWYACYLRCLLVYCSSIIL